MTAAALLAQQTTQTTVSVTAVWIAAGAAVLGASVAALITALYAHRRLQDQLEHDTEQQEAQRAHDRDLRDLEELRALLDECAQRVGASLRTFHPVVRLLHYHALDSDADEAIAEVDIGRGLSLTFVERAPGPVKNALHAFIEASGPLQDLRERVILRLGAEHPIPEALVQFTGRIATILVWLGQGLESEPGTQERSEELDGYVQLLASTHRVFLNESRRLVGSRLRETSAAALRVSESGSE